MNGDGGDGGDGGGDIELWVIVCAWDDGMWIENIDQIKKLKLMNK